MGFPGSLLFLGLIFPAIAWLSVVTGILTAIQEKRSVSFVFIPFVGPISLTIWILVEGHSPWWIMAAWLGDIGTIGSLPSLPHLIRDYWNHSRFTQIMELRGDHGNQSVVITLHQAGNYAFHKSWTLAQGETGTTGLGEPGTFTLEAETIVLISHLGVTRKLIPQENGHFFVDENLGERPDLQQYSLDRWELIRQPTGK